MGLRRACYVDEAGFELITLLTQSSQSRDCRQCVSMPGMADVAKGKRMHLFRVSLSFLHLSPSQRLGPLHPVVPWSARTVNSRTDKLFSVCADEIIPNPSRREVSLLILCDLGICPPGGPGPDRIRITPQLTQPSSSDFINSPYLKPHTCYGILDLL